MSIQTALLGWLYVSSAASVLFLGLVLLAEGWFSLRDWWDERQLRKRRGAFPWSDELWTAEDAERNYPLIDQLADEGEYELMKDRDHGRVYLLPKQRRAA